MNKNKDDDINRIREIINEEKPSFTIFGGDIQFIEIRDNDVRIRTTGFCYT